MQERIPKVARHSSGREADFSIKKEDDPSHKPNLSAANYGDISRVTANVERGENTREKGLVLKRYKGSEFGEHGGAWNRDFAIKAYNAFKAMGLKNIPTTFRPVGTREIVMTDFNSEGKIALSHNAILESRKEKIESFVDFENSIEAIKDDLLKAAIYDVLIGGDSYFFVVPKEGVDVKLDLKIADLEMTQIRNDFTHLERQNDLEKIEKTYKDSVYNLQSALQGNKYFPSEEYCKKLANIAEQILLSPNLSSEIQKCLSQSKESILLDSASTEAEKHLTKVLSTIRTKIARSLYTEVLQEKAVHMGYDMTSYPKLIDGSNETAAYMIYRSENGSSFGIDTLFFGYKDANNTLKIKQLAETRGEMQVTSAKLENGKLILDIDSKGGNIHIEHQLDTLENLELYTNLKESDKALLEMYKKNQFVYHDDSSKVFHGTVKG